MTAFYNLSSLALGLTAWIIGFCLIFARMHRPWLMLLSFTCAGTSLVLQFFEVRHRIQINDLSAILDIYPTMAWVTLILLTETVALNAIALLRHRSFPEGNL